MRIVAVAWIALVGALVLFALVSLSTGDLFGLWIALSPVQQLLVAVIAFSVICIGAATAWQAIAISRVVERSGALGSQVEALSSAFMPLLDAQRSLESVQDHLGGTGPDDVLTALHKRVTESEKRTAVQEGQNRAADLQERLQEMRYR